MKKGLKNILAAVVLSLVAALVLAHPAQDMIESTTMDLMDILAADKERLSNDKEFLKSVVDEKVIPHMDFNAMTALSIGKHWRSASEQQREELISEFQQLLLNTYMSAVSLYSGQSMQFKPFVPQKRQDRAVVRALFVQPGVSNKGVPVNYKLRQKDDEWKVYDIDVNNINLVATYRSTFTQRISQVGIDGLIEEMKEKNAAAAEKK